MERYLVDDSIGHRTGMESLVKMVCDIAGVSIEEIYKEFNVDFKKLDIGSGIMSINVKGNMNGKPIDGTIEITDAAFRVIESCKTYDSDDMTHLCYMLAAIMLEVSYNENLTDDKEAYFRATKSLASIVMDKKVYSAKVGLCSNRLFEVLVSSYSRINDMKKSNNTEGRLKEDECIKENSREEIEVNEEEEEEAMEKLSDEYIKDMSDEEYAEYCSCKNSELLESTEGICSEDDIVKIKEEVLSLLIGHGGHIVVRGNNSTIREVAVSRAIVGLIRESNAKFDAYSYFAHNIISNPLMHGEDSAYLNGCLEQLNYKRYDKDDDKDYLDNIIIVSGCYDIESDLARINGINTKLEYKVRITLANKSARIAKGAIVIDLNESAENRTAAFKYEPFAYIDAEVHSIDNGCFDIAADYIKNGKSEQEIEKLLVEAYKYSMKYNRQGHINTSDFNMAVDKLGWKNTDYSCVKELGRNLKKQIKGQNEAIDKIVRAVKIASVGLNEPDKPVVSMMFVGPTGTGKTETAKQLAAALEREFIRIDMAEYADGTAVNKINGSSAGYVGYEDGSVLEKALRGKEKCVLLFDEIEKAHHTVFDTMLQILDNGELHNNKGGVINFRDAIIIMTSNSGIADMSKRSVGFNTAENVNVRTSEGISECVESALRTQFRGEFLNRIDYIVQFNSIGLDVAREIADKMLKELITKIPNNVIIEDSCYDALAKKGTDIRYGAREIKRTISNDIKSAIADAIIDNNLGMSKELRIGYLDDKVVVSFGRKRRVTV